MKTSLTTMAESLRLAVALLAPVMPGVSAKIQQLLGGEVVERFEGNLEWDYRVTGLTVGEKTILFPRIELE